MKERRDLKVPQEKSTSLSRRPACVAGPGLVSLRRFAASRFPSPPSATCCVRTSQLGSSRTNRSPGLIGRHLCVWLEVIPSTQHPVSCRRAALRPPTANGEEGFAFLPGSTDPQGTPGTAGSVIAPGPGGFRHRKPSGP